MSILARLRARLQRRLSDAAEETAERAPPATLWRSAALALGLGALGGLIAHAAGVPLAFMLGALAATTAASLAGLKPDVPPALRSVGLAAVGLFLGEAFSVGEGARIPAAWAGSLALALLYVPIASALCQQLYARAAGLDGRTALFSAIPGGLTMVVLTSGSAGADERHVALTQTLRVTLVVLAAPALFFGAMGLTEPPAPTAAPVAPLGWGEGALLGAAALAAWAGLAALRAPMAPLIGPIIASGALRLTGVVEGRLPDILVEAAFVVVGAAIGSRFAGADRETLWRLAGWTVAATLVLLALSTLFAAVVTAAFDVPFVVALLAFAPGGITEMCLIAIALDADPSFVAAHHLARVCLIFAAAPLLAVWIARHGGATAD